MSGFENMRVTVKRAWQMMVNARSKRSAIVALAKELGGFREQANVARLLGALESHHKAISQAFYTGAGLRLQHVDSDS